MFLLLHPTTDFHGSFWNLTMCLKSALFFFFFCGAELGERVSERENRVKNTIWIFPDPSSWNIRKFNM